jgi:uncharacterized protein YjbJ (UPF0337 family)
MTAHVVPVSIVTNEITDNKENVMKPSTKNQVKGKAHEIKGAVKAKIGKATNNPDMEAEGQAENLAGKVQNKVGQAGKALGN